MGLDDIEKGGMGAMLALSKPETREDKQGKENIDKLTREIKENGMSGDDD